MGAAQFFLDATMARLFFLALCIGLLSACAHLPQWPLLPRSDATATPSEVGQYSFAWRLSGNREVAPLQVFDNGKKTWLQFAPGQTIPAIFERKPTGDRPLSYQRQGEYIVLPGVWPSLVLRGGRLESRIDRVIHDAPRDNAGAVVTPPSDAHAVQVPVSLPAAPLAQDIVLSQPQETDTSIAALTAASFHPIEAPDFYAVSPNDKNLRLALSRWAKNAGWTFQPEHWVVDADIPIVGSASFDSPFKQAVQDLVGSTELADRPLQPCFYSNQVLRIVPYAQTCDRTAGVGRS